jgi:acetaldehyde dehydrogenase (acetylating)
MLHDQDLLSIQETRSKVQLAWEAAGKYRAFSQEQVDAIVERMAAVAREQAQALAEMAVEETGYGNARDKYAKNMLSADVLCRAMRGMKTVGVLREIPADKVVEIAVPVGVVAAILPTTNPTSTAIYKVLIALKAGNAIVLSPHPRAKNCTCATADLLYRAALEAGAPENVIQCVTNPTLEATNALMRHERTGVILSTGGHGIVKAAYSSGKPAFGVGPGNVPVYIEASADVAESVASVVSGKSFDYGTVCSSEQALVITADRRDATLAALKTGKAYLCDEKQAAALAKLLLTPNFTVNPKCVGQSPVKIARMAGFEVPADTSILAAEVGGVGRQHPLSAEKLSPVLALMFVADHEAALKTCEAILRFGGLGHTCVIYSNDDARIREFGMRMPAFRVLVNTPAPQGSVGITTAVFPSMTLGCGAIAGNITSDNIGPMHLINIKRLAYRVERAAAIPAAAPAAVSPVTASVRPSVAAAVERYLAQRGFAGANPRPASTVEAVVDRFLAARSATTPPAATGSCAAPAAPSNPAPPAPTIHVVDFVCESDVRAAVEAKRKIYIGPKTIVTPSARELGGRHDILVEAER